MNIIKKRLCQLNSRKELCEAIIIAVNVYDDNNVSVLFETTHTTYHDCIDKYEFPCMKQIFDILSVACSINVFFSR